MSHSEINQLEKITGNSPEAKSLDITQQNIEQLKQLFPDVFSENKIDFEALKAVLGEAVDDSEERYNFTWNGKTKARQIAQTPSTGTLRPCKQESVNWDTTENLFIEGDNLEVLKLLQKSYHKKVKMIYIDPPYNTGRDFVYKDNFHDNIKNYLDVTGQLDISGKKISTNLETSGRFHSDWLNMFYPRLKLARNLLKDDGVVFISIDDNELSSLLKISHEIFGEDNFIGIISRSTGTRMGTGSKGLARELDYIVAYSKSSEFGLYKLAMTNDEASIYNEKDDKGRYLLRSLRRTGGENRREDRPTMFYPVTSPDNEDVYPLAPEGWESRWVCGKDTYEQLLANNEIEWKKVKKAGVEKWQVYQKHYISDAGREVSDLWIKEDGNKKATKEVNSLFDGFKIFDHPKPVQLIRKLIQLGTKPSEGDIVLDFFAGSATTGQAVLEQNIEDEGNRKFILVQLREPIKQTVATKKFNFKFISELSFDRIKRAINNLSTKINDNIDSGVKLFKLDETNIRPWDANFENLELVLQQATKSIKDGRSSEDVLYEIFLKYGYDLTTPVKTETVNGKTVYIVGAGALIVCLDDEITAEVVEGIAKLKEKLDPETTQVVFKDAGFADSNVKTNAIQILKQAGIDDVKSI
ncbi:site-specific DNA-methyltransferase [Shewanella glacialipiscicola]|jgi:adenine-specific DNA-methyltransferase|uniref:site-specific DNA-methyltransferase (adenine-specific) n=2 Tax=Shewanella glacialipiscicola TaxID=614069 RepID=A0ABQ6J1M9_9GAMM|nr:site-specific DNA-methyltransferase [Shewanella glacialipiscicola]MCL1087968.1 site-specific DNA-methyltransferase [Shewanella glacialipiscicola]GMA81614.1 DNA methylase N-4 [Shewanella glacialipiscicola]